MKILTAQDAAANTLYSLETFKVVFDLFFQPFWSCDEATLAKNMERRIHEMCLPASALLPLLNEAMNNAREADRATTEAYMEVENHGQPH